MSRLFYEMLLSEIINASFKTGKVTNEIKIAKVIKIYKAGSKMEASNHTPISLLQIISILLKK